MMGKIMLSYFMMVLVVFGGFAPFVTAQFSGQTSSSFSGPTTAGFSGGGYGSVTNSYQSGRPSFSSFYSGSFDTYWPILNNLQEDQCDELNSDFIIGIPPGGCSPAVVRSDLLAEQNVPVFCQLSAIRVNPLIDVSTIKSISFKGDYPDEVAGISFHPARAAVKSYRTLLGDPIDENIGYVVIVLKKQPDERNLEEYISGMLTATIRYDAQGSFGTGAAEYYLEPMSDSDWAVDGAAASSSFWSGKGHLRVTNVDEDEATIEVMTGKDNVYRTVTLKEGETSNRLYYPGQYCTAAMRLKLNKIDNSEDMAKVDIDGDTFWVRKGSKLLGGKCVVRDLNVFPGGSGSVEISCSGNSRFTLTLGDSGVVLNNGTGKSNNINVGVGGTIMAKGKDIYLGYYGKSNALKDKTTNPNGEFAILFDRSLSEDDVSDITRIFDVESFNETSEMEASLDRISKFKGKYEIVGENSTGEYGVKVVSVGFDSVSEGYDKSTYIPKYLGKAEDTVSKLIELFPAERTENKVYWGEEALKKQIALAGRAKDEEMQIDLIKKFLSTYPGSDSVEYMRDVKLNLERFDHAGSSANVFVNNEDYNIRVDGFASGTGASDSVTLRFAGGAAQGDLKRGRTYDVKTFKEIVDLEKQDDIVPRLIIEDIDGSSAKISYIWKDSERDRVTTSHATIQVGESSSIGGVRVQVVSTEVREVAYISLLPEVRYTKTEANFTFNIGVEKRAFELSPEKAQEKVDKLNKSIADWEEKIEKLGELIKGMKAACLVTSTLLTLKSFITGFSGGEAIARKAVMDSYEAKCRAEHPGVDPQECFSVYYKADIERDIDEYGAAIVAVNKDVECAEVKGETVGGGFLETKVIDNEAYVKKLKSCTGTTEYDGIPLDDARDIQAALLKKKACVNSDSIACDIAKKELDRVLADNKDRLELASKKEKNKGVTGIEVPPATNPNIDAVLQQAISAKDSTISEVKDENYLAQVYSPTNPSKRYFVELDKDSQIINVYDERGILVEDSSAIKDEIDKNNNFIIPSGDRDSCSNPMREAHVRYYESGNKQGFVAVVPIDKRDGWYVYAENDAYKKSGETPDYFEICNVGSDGVIGEGSKSGDICQSFQPSSAGEVTTFVPCPGMSSSEVKRLYQKAERAIRDANRNGNGVNLDGEFIHKTTPLGPSSTGLECTDFMSVSDCNLMFNICDPVICPTSRCDLGGAFPVSDVIASGIIGSIVLCLPNFGTPAKGGVLIPVCLSGIHAGLDAYVSILKSHKKCLEENIESGVYTGICDEITAVYTCEFFWGQLSPILDTLLIRFVEGLYGGFQTRGGAEYLTVQRAFDNLDNSIDYFTSSYMSNSFRAFSLRNTEEIGSTVCKGFIGSSVPTSGDMIDSFLEPESPSQFYAYFSEDLFSDATVPSTSHYKVYYHIYAGNDFGAQYRVYMKSPPTSSYYSSRQTILVDSGYAARGVAVDEAIDFTAPSGYKELCVSINGVDECGFGQVTSDFGLNYASQAYVKDQADDRQIATTEDCVTTSVSAWAFASPNIQAGLEKSMGQEDIATSGIIRICASTNPDKGVVGGNDVYCNPSDDSVDEKGITRNPKCAYGYSCVAAGGEATSIGTCKNTNTNTNQVSQGKWVDVGECDGGNMRCWLDSSSVKENLGQYMAVNNLTVNELIRESEDLVELNEQYKNVAEKLGVLKKDYKKFTENGVGADDMIDSNGELSLKVQAVIDGLDEVAGVMDNVGEGSNAAKAQALSMKAAVYWLIVEKLFVKYKDVEGNGGRPVVVTSESECDPSMIIGGTSPDCDDGEVCSDEGRCVECRIGEDDCADGGSCDENNECRVGGVAMVTVYSITQNNDKEMFFVYANEKWYWSFSGGGDWVAVSDKDALVNDDISVENRGVILSLSSEDEEERINGMGRDFEDEDVRADSIGIEE